MGPDSNKPTITDTLDNKGNLIMDWVFVDTKVLLVILVGVIMILWLLYLSPYFERFRSKIRYPELL